MAANTEPKTINKSKLTAKQKAAAKRKKAAAKRKKAAAKKAAGKLTAKKLAWSPAEIEAAKMVHETNLYGKLDLMATRSICNKHDLDVFVQRGGKTVGQAMADCPADVVWPIVHLGQRINSGHWTINGVSANSTHGSNNTTKNRELGESIAKTHGAKTITIIKIAAWWTVKRKS